MEKKKLIPPAVLCAALVAGGISPASVTGGVWTAMRKTALFTAGITETESRSPRMETVSEEAYSTEESSPAQCTEASETRESTAETEERQIYAAELASADITEITAEAPEPSARVISQNITEFDDGIDRTAAGNKSGIIYRRHYGGYVGDDYITLSSGGLVRNCTEEDADKLSAAAEELPDISIKTDAAEPQVLIMHTHTTESYEPYQRSYYDSEYPFRTRDSSYNMVRVGEELAEALAANGISVVHDGTINDYPAYTGAYDRSEEAIRAVLEQYPTSIKREPVDIC